MDTQFKLEVIQQGDLSSNTTDWFKTNKYRSFVGPKGWVIAYNYEEKLWKMTHHYYRELTLTMLEPDVQPVGRHTWNIENNVCTQVGT